MSSTRVLRSSVAHLDAKKKYRAKNKEILARKSREYYLSNKTEINRKRRERYAAAKAVAQKNST